jgi:hypothetical protein
MSFQMAHNRNARNGKGKGLNMPKYRQLHLKILDSVDVNEMPDDFTRLTWVLLALILDSCGRGVDNPAWIRSKMYPLRDDISLDQIRTAIDWFGNHKMIQRYSVAGRNYFCIPTWPLYQTGTDREAPSSIPAPEPLPTPSEPAPDPLPSNQPTNQLNNRGQEQKPSLYPIAEALSKVTGMPLDKNKGRIFKEAKTYKPGEEAQILTDYSLGGPWYKNDWRGKKGERPGLSQIRETFGNLKKVIVEEQWSEIHT